VRTLIVDEIHAIADDKRGSHLALSIARLERLVGAPLQKIGPAKPEKLAPVSVLRRKSGGPACLPVPRAK
jgi:ATP-dependent Lhr-like helicase